jgi:hypothetical protein
MKHMLVLLLVEVSLTLFAQPLKHAAPWESLILTTPVQIGGCSDPSQFPLGVPSDFAPDGYQFVFSPDVTSDCTYALTGGLQFSTSVDSANFSNAASFRLVVNMNVLWDGSAAHTICVRLYNLTNNTAVAGSEVCRTADPTVILAGQTQLFRAESGAVDLPPGPHLYTIQARAVAVPDSDGIVRFGSGFVISARLVN